MDKRSFLKTFAFAGIGVPLSGNAMTNWINRFGHYSAENLAANEDFWTGIRNGYKLKPDYINLENGYYNFLPEEIFKDLQHYCRKTEFRIQQAGEKQFSVLDVPEHIYPFLELHGHEIIFAFIRNAYKTFDNKERIHCDGIIMGKQTSKAAVLYINNRSGVTRNGTKFYAHKVHGNFFPEDGMEEEFNRLLQEDADDKKKWNETHYVKSKPNRLLRYNSMFFHGKHPAKIKDGTRIVLVVFYAKLN